MTIVKLKHTFLNSQGNKDKRIELSDFGIGVAGMRTTLLELNGAGWFLLRDILVGVSRESLWVLPTVSNLVRKCLCFLFIDT